MKAWIKRNLNVIVLTCVLFGQVLMVGLQASAMRQTLLSYWTGTFALPLQRGARAVSEVFVGSWGRYVWLVDTEEENRRLHAEADRLRIQNYFLQQELLRFKSRTELEAYADSSGAETLQATVVASSPNRSAKEVYLDRGLSDGVAPGMAVVTANGIVGKVAAAFGSSSTVLLITDSEAGAGVVLGSSGEPAVLVGNSSKTCRLDHVDPHVPVELGEFVYTSGLDGVFPLGLPVGRVAGIERGADKQAITVRPLAALDRLSEVLVFLKPKYELLPEDLRQAVARVRGTGSADEEPGELQVLSVGIDADRIKQAYRRTVESQGKTVGELTYRGPPDFSDAYDPSRAARAAQSDDRTRER